MCGNYRGNVCQSVGFSQLLIGESPRQGYEITVATITFLNCRLNPTARLKASSWGISKANDSSLSRGSRVPSTGNIRQLSSIQHRRTLPISRKCCELPKRKIEPGPSKEKERIDGRSRNLMWMRGGQGVEVGISGFANSGGGY